MIPGWGTEVPRAARPKNVIIIFFLKALSLQEHGKAADTPGPLPEFFLLADLEQASEKCPEHV